MDDDYANRRPERPERLVNLSFNAMSEPAVLWIETYSKGAKALGDETTRFVNTRARRLLDAMGTISKSNNPASLLDMQQRWISDAVRDYTEQSYRMMEISGNLMRDLFSRSEPPAD